MTCANVLVGLGKIVKGWRLAMLDGRMEVRLSASLPRRERLHHHQPVLREPCISIHAPAKGATYFDYLKVSVRIFQSTLPRRERRASYETRTSGRCYFNPRSREGSDSSANSIINRQTLFQSTLPRKERRKVFAYSIHSIDFNPRSREGSDLWVAISLPPRYNFNPHRVSDRHPRR